MLTLSKKEKKALYDKEYRKKMSPEKVKQYRQNWRKNSPDKQRNISLKANYDITLKQYNEIFTEQKGCCAICGKHQSELKLRLAVDYNHTTGEVRGLLCTRCNVDLGVYENRKEQFKEYLTWY